MEEGSQCLALPHTSDLWPAAVRELGALAEADAVALEDLGASLQRLHGEPFALRGLRAAAAVVAGTLDVSRLVPRMARCALRVSDAFAGARELPRLTAGAAGRSVALTRAQAAALLCCAFFDLFAQACPSFTLVRLLCAEDAAVLLPGILHFLSLCCCGGDGCGTTVAQPAPSPMVVTRLVLGEGEAPEWAAHGAPLLGLEVSGGVRIEEVAGSVQADFANRYLGGGVLHGGRAQEEIRFGLVSPALIAAVPLVDPMGEREALLIDGAAERFGAYSGYGNSVAWAGPCDDATRGEGSSVLAIDALMFPARGQYTRALMERELCKAYAGLRSLPGRPADRRPFATGHWGCGVFGGDRRLKALLQWMAASAAAGRDTIYCTFGSAEFEAWLVETREALKGKRVCDAWEAAWALGEEERREIEADEAARAEQQRQQQQQQQSEKHAGPGGHWWGSCVAQ